MFNKATEIVKYIDENIDSLFEDILGSAIDEYDEKYSSVYKYEINEFISRIESDFKILEKAEVFLSKQEILNTVLINWGCSFSDKDYINNLTTYINILLESVYCDNDTVVKASFNDRFLEFIASLAGEKIYSSEKTLSAIVLDEDDSEENQIMRGFKKMDIDRYNRYIESLKKDYVTASNLNYSITGKEPYLSKIIHESICRHFGIARSEFDF